MKHSVLALAFIGAAIARPAPGMTKREVPQEHAHQNIVDSVNKSLQKNNPDKIQDAVFGLLGAAAGIKGAGNIKDADCLQQATADQAFTNAKAAGDIQGMTDALIFRALERNTGKIGLASVPCASIKAVNPEIAALQQHQDPAGTGAQALNKQIAQELAKQIASIGGDPTQANEASTFAPGNLDDATAKGNTCDVATDAKGCINSQNLRVDDLSAAEIQAAAAGSVASNGTAAASNGTAAVSNDNAAASNGTAVAGNNGKKKAKDAKKKAKDAKKKAKDAKAKAKATKAKADKKKKANAAQGAANNNSTAAAVAAPASADANAGAAAGAAASGAADFGKCSNPTIKFGLPSDGRKEDAFEPADLAQFNHGSALNIAVISNFICSQVGSSCKGNAAAVSKCDAAATAANGLKAAAAADAFNSAIGV